MRLAAALLLFVSVAHAQVSTAYDRLMQDLMQRYNIPGGALAVTQNGRLVFSKGYGFADQDRKTPVRPDSLFRIASISKTFTSAAILKLVEQGKLRLDDKAFNHLKNAQPADPRIAKITIRQILHHTGGWDRNASFDPMFRPIVIAQAVGLPPPASCDAIIQYMLGQKLDFDPGSKFGYSNFGFCVLGRIIESASGMHYEDFVRREILRPAGITRMKLGSSLHSDVAAGEVHYYADSTTGSVFPPFGKTVPWPYGGFNLEAMDSHGGWIASAIDLVKFANAIDHKLLTPASIRELISRPAPPMPQDPPAYYGLGWNIRPVGDDANWWHDGSLPGTTALLVRTHHGYCWAALFNKRAEGSNQLTLDLDSGLWKALDEVTFVPR